MTTKEHRGTGKMSPEPKSSEPTWYFNKCPDSSSSDTNPADNEPIMSERNKGYPKYSIDEFETMPWSRTFDTELQAVE